MKPYKSYLASDTVTDGGFSARQVRLQSAFRPPVVHRGVLFQDVPRVEPSTAGLLAELRALLRTQAAGGDYGGAVPVTMAFLQSCLKDYPDRVVTDERLAEYIKQCADVPEEFDTVLEVAVKLAQREKRALQEKVARQLLADDGYVPLAKFSAKVPVKVVIKEPRPGMSPLHYTTRKGMLQQHDGEVAFFPQGNSGQAQRLTANSGVYVKCDERR